MQREDGQKPSPGKRSDSLVDVEADSGRTLPLPILLATEEETSIGAVMTIARLLNSEPSLPSSRSNFARKK